jgi:hypothetical protein
MKNFVPRGQALINLMDYYQQSNENLSSRNQRKILKKKKNSIKIPKILLFLRSPASD